MTNLLYWFVLGSGLIGFLICVMFSKYFTNPQHKYYSKKSFFKPFNTLGLMFLNIFAISVISIVIWMTEGVLGVTVYEVDDDRYGVTRTSTLFFFAFSLASIFLAVVYAAIYKRLSPKIGEKVSIGPLENWVVGLKAGSLILIAMTAIAVVLERISDQEKQQTQVDREKVLRLVVTSFEKEFKAARRTRCLRPDSNPYNFPTACYPIDDAVSTIKRATDRALNKQSIQPGDWNVASWYRGGEYQLKDWPRFRVSVQYYPKTDEFLGTEEDGEYWEPYRPHKALLEITIQ